MANRYGEMETESNFISLGLKLCGFVQTASIKLKGICSLEEKL